MFLLRFSPIILALQGFCLYHAYRNNQQQKWFFLIIFLPLIGCIIYLYSNFYSKDNVETITEGIKSVVNSNRQIEKLEKEVRVSGTVTNKLLLADEYIQIGRHKDAIDLCNTCLQGFSAKDENLLLCLIRAHYLDKNYAKVIEHGKNLLAKPIFKKADEHIAYAWALHFEGQSDMAEASFKKMDSRFSNYKHRLEYARFLVTTDRKEEAKQKLQTLIGEFEDMDGYERKLKKGIIREVKGYARSL